MSRLLYISYSSGLSEEDKLILDKSAFENREAVCIFVRDIKSNVNHKTKRVILLIGLVSGVWFSNLESVEAIGLPMAPTPVVRVQPSFEHSLKKPEIAKLVPRKPDRTSYKYFSKSKEELLLLIYATDPRLASNQQVFKLVKELRGGSWGLVGTAAFLGLIILIFSMGEGFQVPIVHPNGGVDRPVNGGVQQQISCRRLSMFDSQQFENQEKFVMSKQEALNLLDNTYTGSKKISETEKISDWQMAKKVYHLNGLGVNPEKYEMSKDELNAIRKDGLIKYTMKGGTLPPIELIYEGQNQIEEICQNETTFRKENGSFGKVKKPSNFYYNRDTRQIIYFDKFTGDLIMGDKFRQPYFNKALINNNISILDTNEEN